MSEVSVVKSDPKIRADSVLC